MRRILIASCVAITLASGLAGSAVVAHAVEAPAAIVTGQVSGPLRLFFSGQVGRLLTLRSELNLSDGQRQQIAQIIQSHRAEIAIALRPIVEKRRALRDAVMAETTDEKAIRAASANLVNSIGDAAVLAARVRAELSNVLTPDQRGKIAQFRKDSGLSVDRFPDNMAKPS